MGTVKAGVLAVLVLCWSAGCQQTEGRPVEPLAPRSEAEMQHAAEIRRLMEDLKVDLREDNEDNFNRYHAAKKRLLEIMQESDIPTLEEHILKGDYRDLSKDVRGKGGWHPEVYVSKKEKKRLDAQWQLASALRDILRDYYIRTNSFRARDVFLRILKERDELHFAAVEKFVEIGENRKDVLLPGLKKTDWIETVHRQYRTFDRLEASLEAARLLYIDGKYRDEAVWFFCTVLKDEKMECSQNAIEMIRYLNGYRLTRRQCAVRVALEYLHGLAANEHDLGLLRHYAIPWAKYVRDHETGVARGLAKWILDPRIIAGGHLELDKKSIPEGTPVPPKPATVIDLPQQAKSSAEAGDTGK